jgi:hypothetical protein
MSRVMVSVGRWRNSSQVHRLGPSISPTIENVQAASEVRGVGPADSTGKSRSRYWPGGRRPCVACSERRPRKPREMMVIIEDTSVAVSSPAGPGLMRKPLPTLRDAPSERWGTDSIAATEAADIDSWPDSSRPLA